MRISDWSSDVCSSDLLRDQPEDRGQVEEANSGQGSADRAEGCSFDGAEHRGRGDHRRLPQTHAAALGRLSLCATGDDPAPDPLVIAPLPETSWDQPPDRKSVV